jgi:hypothetical protein
MVLLWCFLVYYAWPREPYLKAGWGAKVIMNEYILICKGTVVIHWKVLFRLAVRSVACFVNGRDSNRTRPERECFIVYKFTRLSFLYM